MHTFDLQPATRLSIGGSTYEILPLPAFSTHPSRVARLEGRQSLIWCVRKMENQHIQALKVFKDHVRSERTQTINNALEHYRNIPGFALSQRFCLTRPACSQVIDEYPALEFALLMPWLTGQTWSALMLSPEIRTSYRQEQAFTLAYATANALQALERGGYAHTDIAGRNVLYYQHFQQIELLDLDGLFVPNMPPPATISRGSPGYQHHALVRNGQWSPTGDRFAGAILLTEMLTVWHPEVQKQLQPSAPTLFQPEELQRPVEQRSVERCLPQVRQALGELDGTNRLLQLFEQAWNARSLYDCPALTEWFTQLHELVSQKYGPPRPTTTNGLDISASARPDTIGLPYQPSGAFEPPFGPINSHLPDPHPPVPPSPNRRTRRAALILAGAVVVLSGGAVALTLLHNLTPPTPTVTPGPTPTPTPSPTPTPTPTPTVVSWTNNQSTGQTSSLAPALAVLNNTLYMSFVDTTNNNILGIVSLENDGSWGQDLEIMQYSAQAPALAVLDGTLYMAFVANNFTDDLLVISSSDGRTWTDNLSANDQSSSQGPALAVLNDTLYMAFVADDSSNNLLIISSSDGITWSDNQPVGPASSLAPAMAVLNGRLYMAYVDTNDNNNVLIISSSDGSTWTGSQQTGQTSSAAPALAVLSNTLYMVFVSKNSSNSLLFVSSQDGINWSDFQEVGQTSAAAPALALSGNTLSLAFVSNNGADDLLFVSSQD